MDAVKNTATNAIVKLKTFDRSQLFAIGILLVSMIIYLVIGIVKIHSAGQYSSNPDSVSALTSIQNTNLQDKIGSNHSPNTNTQLVSVCKSIKNTATVYSNILSISNKKDDYSGLVNWRPLTVRLAGYFNGINSIQNGVFDNEIGSAIKMAIEQGAKAFIFDIDYLDSSPCTPVLIYRDSNFIMRSLNTGDLTKAFKTLQTNAFNKNTDPVLVILHFIRVPPGPSQKDIYTKSVAKSLQSLTSYLTSTKNSNNFYNCGQESLLFTSPITDYESKIIIVTNYDSSKIVKSNPKDSLFWWTNALIYRHTNTWDSSVDKVTETIPSGKPSYIQIGSSINALTITNEELIKKCQTSTREIFTITMAPVDFIYKMQDMTVLLNTLGIQCVPVDVLGLSASDDHKKTLTEIANLPGTNIDRYILKSTHTEQANPLNIIIAPTSNTDVLSYWTIAGWSYKLVDNYDGFQDYIVPVAVPIPGYKIPKPIIPKKPHPSMNSNGGLLSIA